MNIDEYVKVKNFTYLEYCFYLQMKYGIGRDNYMNEHWTKSKKVTRTAEGLFAHHKYEDHAIMLSTKECAEICPYEWQRAENIVYCDYLEHLYLHILICDYPSSEKIKNQHVGIGGVINFIAPELNDLYSGYIPGGWKTNCFDKVKDDKDVYLTLMHRFISAEKNRDSLFSPDDIQKSYGSKFGVWKASLNDVIYGEIVDFFDE